MNVALLMHVDVKIFITKFIITCFIRTTSRTIC